MVDDPVALRILLARCQGTLEGIYGIAKLPTKIERHVRILIGDIEKATTPTLEQAKELSDQWDREEAIKNAFPDAP